jgi:exopolysaccharide biosynthesis polyprenyl glycosylphosphotransferase
MSTKVLTFVLIFLDWATAVLAWGVFYFIRKIRLEQTDFTVDNTFYLGLVIIPFMWLILYLFQGTYQDVRRLYRLKILSLTLGAVFVGSICIFFAFLLDDQVGGYQTYYKSIFILMGVQLAFTLLPRFVFVGLIVRKIHKREQGFRTLLIGGSEKAVSIYNEINSLPKGTGNLFVGFVNINGVDRLLESELPYLGHADQLETILRDNNIEEVVIALDSSEHERLRNFISRIGNGSIKIKILPDLYDILSGSVKMNNIFGALLIEVNSYTMPFWQHVLKRLFDILFSLIAIILLSPLYLVLAIIVKRSSKGPILFMQERVGLNGKTFKIIKYRTMYMDAESKGPQLSSSEDPRITPAGRVLRRYRLDEFLQFVNVLKGDMSLVGPRPERQFYIDQITQVEPHFHQLTNIRPGVTSWGQVKYGYAENVDEMLQRMKYDLLYLKNQTLALDFKIMLHTISIVLKAQGK